MGDQKGIASALGNLGAIAYYEGDLAASRRFWEESLTLKRAVGNPFPIYVSLYSLGRINFAVKDYLAAGTLWRECLTIVVEHRLKGAIPWALNVLGGLLAAVDTPLNASRLWGAAERLYEEGSEPMNIQVRDEIERQVAAARAALGDDAAFDAAWQKGRLLTLEQAVALARTDQPA